MALTGVHVLCTSVRIVNGASLTGASLWSETLAAPGTTTQSAPGSDAVFEVRAAVDAYVAIGKNPDASQISASAQNTARVFIPGGETRNLFCSAPGDRLAWFAA